MLPAAAVRLEAAGCVTGLGDTAATHAALLRGERALRLMPVLGAEGGEPVPLALADGRGLDETAPPELAADAPDADRRAFPLTPGARRPARCLSPAAILESAACTPFGGAATRPTWRTARPRFVWTGSPANLGWGPNVTTLSHACVSAHLGLMLAGRLLHAGLAERALVFSFDFISPFVTGGFHALKILNSGMPAPYADRSVGSIGLGDGAGFAVLTRDRGDFEISAQSVYNEMHHFTANRADGTGFAACLGPVKTAAEGRRLWLKGHGTGTLEAGRLESAALASAFPEAPLVSWKGSLGHTLGSCGLVELARAVTSMRAGRAPGTIGSAAPCFTPEVALESFSTAAHDGVVCASNAFGGAHAAFLLTHA